MDQQADQSPKQPICRGKLISDPETSPINVLPSAGGILCARRLEGRQKQRGLAIIAVGKINKHSLQSSRSYWIKYLRGPQHYFRPHYAQQTVSHPKLFRLTHNFSSKSDLIQNVFLRSEYVDIFTTFAANIISFQFHHIVSLGMTDPQKRIL